MRVVADRTGTNANLDGVGAGVDQCLGAIGRRHVAGDHLHVVGKLLHLGDGLQHIFRMAVGRVDHQHVDTGVNQGLRTFVSLVADGGGCGNAQAPLIVLGCVGVEARLFDVFHGDQADALIGRIHHQQLFNPMLMQKALGLVVADALAHRYEVLPRHQLVDALIGSRRSERRGWSECRPDGHGCGHRLRRSPPPECRRCCAPS